MFSPRSASRKWTMAIVFVVNLLPARFRWVVWSCCPHSRVFVRSQKKETMVSGVTVWHRRVNCFFLAIHIEWWISSITDGLVPWTTTMDPASHQADERPADPKSASCLLYSISNPHGYALTWALPAGRSCLTRSPLLHLRSDVHMSGIYHILACK